MDGNKMDKAAVGRLAMMGDLYNAHRDEFLSINAFKEPLKTDEIFEYETNSTIFHCIETNSVREEFQKLGIDEELSLSIMCGLVNAGGFSVYPTEQTKRVNSHQMTLIYTLFTKTEEVDGIRSKIKEEHLSKNATHIVAGIKWGMQCSIICRHDADGRIETEQVQKKLKAEMEKLKGAISANESKTTVDSFKQGEESNIKVSYRASCSIGNLGEDLPQSLEEVQAVAKSMSNVVAQKNNGKGVPINYILLPLNILRKVCKIKIAQDAICKPTEKHIASMCFEFMQRVRECRQRMYGLLHDFLECEEAVSEEDLAAATDLQKGFEGHVRKCKSRLGKDLSNIRLGKLQEASMINMLQQCEKGRFSPTEIDNTLKSHDCALQKIKFVNECKEKGVLYIGREGNFDSEFSQNMGKTIFVFYMDYGKQFTRVKEWREYKELFFKLVAAYNCDRKVKLMVVDLDFQSKMTTSYRMRIEHYDQGEFVCGDLVEKEGQDLSKCLMIIKVSNGMTQKPSKRLPFEIPCPLSFKSRCPVEDCQWICRGCREFVEYETNGKFLYCKCGKSDAFGATFRCSSEMHGLSFEAYTHADLQTQLSSLDAVKETNILLLGETGVGKSTWINAIANYFAFGSLQEAIDAKDMKVLIPCEFEPSPEENISQKVSVGAMDTNENMKVAEHGTVRPKEYMLYCRRHILRFIDTPGICDARGPDQDKKSVESILDFLAYYDKIHAICILLKPQESRLTVSLRFCIIELLTHLHKSAAENVVFCFTHSRNTFYTAGNTLSTLTTLFQEYDSIKGSISLEKRFCFDNEAFRLLACYQSGLKFSTSYTKVFSSSWDKSVSDMLALLKYIDSLSPHLIQETISLNNARRIIIELAKPLAIIAENLQGKIVSKEAKLRKLELSPNTDAELEEILLYDNVDLEFIKLDHPRTVCTHPKCVTYAENDSGTKKAIYKQICHDNCTLVSISPQVTNDSRIRWCRAFYHEAFNLPVLPLGSQCNKCRHSWEVHTHSTYDIEEKIERVKDESTQNILDEKESYPNKVAAIITKLRKNTIEMQEEKEEVIKISAQLGCFLKKHAITPFNDNFDKYLERLIEVEKERQVKDTKNMELLENLRISYEKKKKDIQTAMNNPSDSDVEFISSPEEVIKLAKKLEDFKTTGKYIKKFNEAIKGPRNEPFSLSVSRFKSQLSKYLSKGDVGELSARENEDC